MNLLPYVLAQEPQQKLQEAEVENGRYPQRDSLPVTPRLASHSNSSSTVDESLHRFANMSMKSSAMAESGVITASHLRFGARLISSSQELSRSRATLVSSQRRATLVVVSAQEGNPGDAKTKKVGVRRPSEGLFSFVTDNDSSRNAIQLPNAPAEDGNLGQMISQIENKGRDYGAYVRAGDFRWWVRETGTADARNGTVVFLHGAPTQSYSYRVVLAQMAKEGYHCYAPDWIGFGFSEKPQPEYDFAYTEDAYHEELDKLIAKLDIPSPFYLVTQGFIVGSYGLTWALKNPTRVKKLVAMNTPLTPSAPLPGIFQQLRFPLVGEFTCQNAILSERFVEAGSPYVLELDDADVYRLPYLDSSDPGFSLLAASRKAPLKDLTTRIAQGFASPSWKVPTTVAWGMSDKHLPKSEAEKFVKSNPSVLKAAMLDGVGHLPQEDWPEKVVEALTRFFY